MLRSSLGLIMRVADLLNRETPRLDSGVLNKFVQSFLDRRNTILDVVKSQGSPLYLFDKDMLVKRATQFKQAFLQYLPHLKIYYAVKSNSHPVISSTLLKHGFGLDVSSGQELQFALDLGCNDIIFSGPGKQSDELGIVLKHPEKITVLLDSFNELNKLDRMASTIDQAVQVGVRLTTDENSIWRKFGIPIDQLETFFKEAEKCRFIRLRGLQFHLSWNLDSEAHVLFIARLGAALSRMHHRFRKQIKFIDIGGGFWPEVGEWLQPAATPKGVLKTFLDTETESAQIHYAKKAIPINSFASNISMALEKHIPQDMDYTICTEPGRWLCHDAMHIILKVVDCKPGNVIITDGGTNAVGWDRFETDFFPVINLTRPETKEHECLVAGSLCTPHDIWGYSYFGDGVKEGDILLVPNQGAYTYSLRQEFIKPLPKIAEFKSEQEIIYK